MRRRLRQVLQRSGGLAGLLVLAWLLGQAAQAMAQEPLTAQKVEMMRKTKAPEDWTLEERLAVRFDPGDVKERRAAARRDLMKGPALLPEIAEARTAPPDPNSETNHINGQRNPELFLPIEVFESLLMGAFAEDPQTSRLARSTMQEGLMAAGLDPETFWQTLEVIAREPIRAHRELYALAMKMGKATPTDRKAISEQSGVIVAKLCGRQTAALAEARKRFGAKAFDRFLYRAVAPSMFKVMLSEDPEWEVQLRRKEGGCHDTPK